MSECFKIMQNIILLHEENSHRIALRASGNFVLLSSFAKSVVLVMILFVLQWKFLNSGHYAMNVFDT